MKKQVCVIFDIGKTNKKYFIFDQNYQILEEFSTQFEEISDGDGYHGDDLKALTNWMKTTMSSILKAAKYEVKAVNFSAYGASFVHLGADGEPLTPLYNYLKSLPYDLRQTFFKDKVSVEQFCTETASPDLGMLNSGLQLFWLKNTKPEIFQKLNQSLHLPQYCSYIFSRKTFADKTSIGCHTALWDFKKDAYHQWVLDEKLDQKQAQIADTSHFEESIFESKNIRIGVGIHDSSAALVPYLQTLTEPFILLSTGTWCVCMNPFNEEVLTQDELAQDSLCYLNYEGKPVKAARLFSGNEHERQTKHLAEYFDKNVEYYKTVQFDGAIIRSLRTRLKQAIPDFTTVGLLTDCPFVERNLNQFKNYEEAYHQFIQDLIAQQVASLKLIFGKKTPKNIFVEGGFAQNTIYMNLLSESFTGIKVQQTKLGQASAIGAALVIKEAWGGADFTIEMLGV
jgi:L-fuculokinase